MRRFRASGFLFLLVLAGCFMATLIGCRFFGYERTDPVGAAGPATMSVYGRVYSAPGVSPSLLATAPRGLVRGEAFGAPVPGALVWLESNPTDVKTTNANGDYSFVNVAPGLHRVVAKTPNGAIRTQKVRSSHLALTTESPVGMQDLIMKVAEKSFTGVLRYANGEPVPANIPLSLWGETFYTQADGYFQSPMLPNDEFVAEIIVASTTISDVTVVRAPILATDTPSFVEAMVPNRAAAGPRNTPPVVLLTATNLGTTTNVIRAGDQLQVRAEAFDPDPEDMNSLRYRWISRNGLLATSSVLPAEATWTASTTPGLSWVQVMVTDTHGAFSSSRVAVMVGIDHPPTTIDNRPLQIVNVVPASGASPIAASSTIAVTFDRKIDAGTVSSSTFIVSSGTTVLAGAYAVSGDEKTVTFTPAAPLPMGTAIAVVITRDLRDPTGSGLLADRRWTFGVSILADNSAPLGPELPSIVVDAGGILNLAFTKELKDGAAGKGALEQAFSAGQSPAPSFAWTGTFREILSITGGTGGNTYASVTATFSDTAGNSNTQSLVQ